MPRTFKFSFPLPGRKASDDKKPSPGAASTPNDSHDDSPFSDPGSKAERILGTMDLAPTPDHSTKATRKALRKQPSFMSVTISEAESDSAAARDGFPFPGMPSSRGSSRRPSHALRNQPSSPLLGDRFPKDSPGTDSMTDNSSPRPHFYGSSSTLRSYYDPSRSPLSISQQTSASSARDMALRKGLPSISSPLSQDVSEQILPSVLKDQRRPATGNAPGNRPVQLNMSDPPLQPQSFPSPMVSPDQVSKSPSQMSYSSSPQSGSTGRPNWWKRKKAKESKAKEATMTSEDPRFGEGDFGVESLKTNIKKPRAGTQHWFDDRGEAKDPDPYKGQLNEDEAHRQFWNRRLNNLRQGTDDPSGQSSGETQENETQPSNELVPPDPVKTINLAIRLNSPSSQTKDTSSQTSLQRARSRSLNSAKADLLNQSFLELSSSSDDEAEGSTIEAPDYRRHRIRDSIDQCDLGEDVLLTKAERIRPVKPKPVVNPSPRRSKRESEVIPPVPKIPERPQLQQRVSSMRWRESTISKSSGLIAPSINSTTSSNGDASLASHTSSSRPPASEAPAKKFGHGSRLMAVTVEESELLEAMRKKRASARSDPFSPGYVRPKTAGATDSRGSYFGSDLSGSSPPSLPSLPDPSHTYSINNGPHSPFQFPDVPLELPPPRRMPRQAPPIVFPPPKSSPTESFSPSDILPSTPRSRLSPLTPPPSQEMGKGLGRMRHDRKRTMSSGIVMLDDVREKANWESEEEGWAFGREERW
ncbi:MAG: hypothetical protein Q9218_000310 [Villophora microphyllina]